MRLMHKILAAFRKCGFGRCNDNDEDSLDVEVVPVRLIPLMIPKNRAIQRQDEDKNDNDEDTAPEEELAEES